MPYGIPFKLQSLSSLIASLFHIIHETLKKSILLFMTSNLFSLDDLG